MNHRHVLIVDDDQVSLNTILKTLEDAQVPYEVSRSNADAQQQLREHEFTLVLVRGFGRDISGAELCREIRSVYSQNVLPVLVMLRDDELVSGAEALLAGANDLLIDPFEPRELRMRAGIVPKDQQRRIDEAHTEHDVEPTWIVPEFDGGSRKFTFGPHADRVRELAADNASRQAVLDTVIVCPKCEAVPTFRHGCGHCGGGRIKAEVLIHHYACAHVGPESEFQSDHGLVCPKCRVSGLVAGSDFEQIAGSSRCLDCDAVVSEPQLIGHCLNCQHRFKAEEGLVKEIVGYAPPAPTRLPVPNYLAAGGRSLTAAPVNSVAE